MTDRELRHMKRSELLELLIVQIEENELLRDQLEQAQQQLEDRRICMAKSGSIAEAALQLNGVFEAAETAAAQYLESVRLATDRQDEICRQMQQEAEEKARETIAEAEAYCADIKAAANRYWDAVVQKADGVQVEKPSERGTGSL